MPAVPVIWVAIGLLAVFALAPLVVALERQVGSRGSRDLAVALHRGQLVELDRDLAEGRILPAEHKTAVLEVQRRLLAVADGGEAGARVGARWPVVVTAGLVPAAALGLYLIGGSPSMPSVRAGGEAQRGEMEGLVTQLREQVPQLDPASEMGRRGYLLLGNVEESLGNDRAAVAAWGALLKVGFDPVLAVRTAMAMERVEGGLSGAGEALLRRALAEGAADAPWRGAVEERLRLASPSR